MAEDGRLSAKMRAEIKDSMEKMSLEVVRKLFTGATASDPSAFTGLRAALGTGGRLPTIPIEPDEDWLFGTVLKPVGMPWSNARCMAVTTGTAVVLREDDDGDATDFQSGWAIQVGELIGITPGYWEPAE